MIRKGKGPLRMTKRVGVLLQNIDVDESRGRLVDRLDLQFRGSVTTVYGLVYLGERWSLQQTVELSSD